MKKLATILIVMHLFCINAICQIPTDSLVIYYPFNNSTIDESGNNLNGVGYNCYATNDRFFNLKSAYDFNGSNSYIEIPDSIILKPNFPFTISLWVKVDSFSNVSSVLFANDEFPEVYSGAWIGYIPSGHISAGYGDGLGHGTSHRVTKHSNTVIDTSDWHLIIASFNGLLDIDLYVDCEIDSGFYSGNAYNMGYLGNNGVIGRNLGHSTNSYHNGKVDDIRLYNRILTPKEIGFICYETPCYDYITIYDTITVVDSISVTDTLIIDIALSLPPNIITNSIKVYPNPTNDIVFINTGEFNIMPEYSIKIINNLGSVIFENLVNQQEFQIDINTFGATGLYYIQIFNDQNQLIDTRKIILK